MKSCYISGPLTAKTPEKQAENVEQAAQVAARYYAEGWAVYCPHLQTKRPHEILREQGADLEYPQWLARVVYWVEKSDVVVMLPGWRQSFGSLVEYGAAREQGKEIVFEEAGSDADGIVCNDNNFNTSNISGNRNVQKR